MTAPPWDRARAVRRRAVTASAVVLALAGLAAPPASRAAPDPGDPGDPLDRRRWTTVANGDEVLALAADPADPGRLWAGTEGGGVVIWDVAQGDFAQHVFPAPDGPADNVVHDIAFDPSGTAWLATRTGVTHADGAEWGHFAPGALDPPDVRAIAVAADGTVWAGGPGGLASLPAGRAAWRDHPAVPYKPREPTDRDGPGFGPVVDLAFDGRGDLWVAHGRGGVDERPALSVRRAATGRWDHVAATPPDGAPETGPPTDQVMALVFDAATDRLWAGTWGRGVVYYDGARRAWRRPPNDGLCSAFIWSLFARGGAVWAGCGDDWRGRGIARWDGVAWEAWTTADGLPDDTVAAIAMAGGRVWLGANGPHAGGHGIVAFDAHAGRADGPRLVTHPRTPASNDVTAVLIGPDGGRWVGTRGAGLLGQPAGGGDWAQHTVASTGGRLPGDTVTDLAWRNGTLWVATTQTKVDGRQLVDGGVGRLDTARGAWLPALTAATSGLPANDVGSLAVDAAGRVWIGLGAAVGGPASPDATHAGHGLAVYAPEADRWTVHRFDKQRPKALVGDTVMDVAAAGDDVWLAASYHLDGGELRSFGGGVSRWRGGAWAGWGNGDAGLRTWSGRPGVPGSTAFITGDVRSILAAGPDDVLAGTWSIEGDGSVVDRWPDVDAVVNRWDGAAWSPTVFAGAGWIAALARDPAGRVWAGATRGHDRHEVSLTGAPRDDAAAGLFVREGGQWRTVDPAAGVAAGAVTALAVDAATGSVWVGTENGGLSVFAPPTARPTDGPPTATVPVPTACGACASPTPSGGTPPPGTATPPDRPVRTATPEASPTPRAGARLHLPWASTHVARLRRP